MALSAAIGSFRDAPLRWWVCGGHALELHLGASWRPHDDTDVSVLRGDVPGLRRVLDGWDLHLASGGVLTPWDGSAPDSARNQNNLWCRTSPDHPWSLDITVGDGDASQWIFRREPTLRAPWRDAVLTTADGVPYLAPELQLLFKSRTPRSKDTIDASEVIPHLESPRRDRLASLLPAGHPWRPLLDA